MIMFCGAIMFNPHSVTQTHNVSHVLHMHTQLWLRDAHTRHAPGFHICLHSLPPSHNFSCRGHPLPRSDTAVMLCNVTLVWKEVSKRPQCLLRMPWRVWKSRLSEAKIIFVCPKSIHRNGPKTSHRVNTPKRKRCWAVTTKCHRPPRPDSVCLSRCSVQAAGSVSWFVLASIQRTSECSI